jgi:protein O-GlcNAc transferase
VAPSLAAYEAQAVILARDSAALSAIREKLARNRGTHPLFDTDRYTRHLERAYVAMQSRAQEGLPPADIAVPRLPPP